MVVSRLTETLKRQRDANRPENEIRFERSTWQVQDDMISDTHPNLPIDCGQLEHNTIMARVSCLCGESGEDICAHDLLSYATSTGLHYQRRIRE